MSLYQAPRALVVKLPDERLARVFLSTFIIGQHPNAGLRIHGDEHVSSFHAQCTWRYSEWTITDLESANGTWFADDYERIFTLPLARGDKIRIGRTVLLFVPA